MLKPGADAIDALLPQTQCTRCGFAGCRPYAEAIERGEAGINQCPPGGAATILSLSRLLGREPLPLDPAHGTEREPTVAWIDESLCIGCARSFLDERGARLGRGPSRAFRARAASSTPRCESPSTSFVVRLLREFARPTNSSRN